MIESNEVIHLWVMCNDGEEESGPTTITVNSGDDDGSVQAEILRMLQKSFPGDKLSEDANGVNCTEPPTLVVQVLQQNGLHLIADSWAHGDKRIWSVSNRKLGREKEEEDDEDQE